MSGAHYERLVADSFHYLRLVLRSNVESDSQPRRYDGGVIHECGIVWVWNPYPLYAWPDDWC